MIRLAFVLPSRVGKLKFNNSHDDIIVSNFDFLDPMPKYLMKV